MVDRPLRFSLIHGAAVFKFVQLVLSLSVENQPQMKEKTHKLPEKLHNSLTKAVPFILNLCAFTQKLRGQP